MCAGSQGICVLHAMSGAVRHAAVVCACVPSQRAGLSFKRDLHEVACCMQSLLLAQVSGHQPDLDCDTPSGAAGPCCWATPCAAGWMRPLWRPRMGSVCRTPRLPGAAPWSLRPAQVTQQLDLDVARLLCTTCCSLAPTIHVG